MHAYISTFAERGVIAFWDGTSKGTAQVSPSRKSLTTLLGLSGLTLATAFMAHDFIGTYYRQTVISNES